MSNNLDQLCRRFEIAVENFGRSCIDLQSNEATFQAWFAACLIQEFGQGRVYREVHLERISLLSKLNPVPDFIKKLRQNSELKTDIAITWDPYVDTRHSATREKRSQDAGDMLLQLGIITELKVTGSKKNRTPDNDVIVDFQKLAAFSAARALKDSDENERGLAAYMIILDNNMDAKGNPKADFPHKTFGPWLARKIKPQWPENVNPPRTLLLSLERGACVMHKYVISIRPDAV